MTTTHSSSPLSTSKPILIIGAGLGGLCLAHGLKKANIPFRVYERDPSATFRPQGYRIRISSDGAAALNASLSPEQWVAFERACAEVPEGMSSIDALTGDLDPNPHKPMIPRSKHDQFGSYTADRLVTRNVLLRGLEGHLEWAKGLKSSSVDDAGVTTEFTDGTNVRGSLLVGADGVRSSVRRQFFAAQAPVDTRGRAIYGKSILTPDVEAQLSGPILNTTCLIQDRSRHHVISLFVESIRFPRDNDEESPSDYVYWVLVSQQDMFPLPESAVDVPHLSNEAAANLALKTTEHWSDRARAVIRLQDRTQTSGLRICTAIPDRLDWKTTDRVTLVGDAAHVVPPAGGHGANLALRDAAALVAALVESRIGAKEKSETEFLRAAVPKYEDAMREYVLPSMHAGVRGGVRFFDQPPWDECADAEF